MRVYLVFLILAIFLASCAKTVEGQKKRWQSNINRIQRVAIDYPAFKTILEDRRMEAQEMMDDAMNISDEELRIDAMSEANDVLIPDFVRGLENIERQIKEVQELRREVFRNADERVEEMLADVAAKEADRAIESARERLRQPPVINLADAAHRVGLAVNELSEAENTLKKVIAETSAPEAEDTASQTVN